MQVSNLGQFTYVHESFRGQTDLSAESNDLFFAMAVLQTTPLQQETCLNIIA